MIRPGSRRTLTVAAIGLTQTLAWGSSYYLPAILADPIAAGLGVSKALFFGFFSAALLLQAALGPAIGKAIDRRGGRGVLVLSNLVLGAELMWLASAQGAVGLAGAWVVLGIGMALGLYDRPGLRAPERSRQRALDDITQNPAAGAVRPGRVWAAQRDHPLRRRGSRRPWRRFSSACC